MRFIIIIFLLSLVSCRITKDNCIAHYQHYNKLNIVKYTMNIPINYLLIEKTGEGEVGYEKQYIYSDSSIIYISDFNINVNYNNLLKSNQYEKYFISFLNGDTISLSGINNNGLWWRNIRFENVSIGYLNVKENHKFEFDKSLNSFVLEK